MSATTDKPMTRVAVQPPSSAAGTGRGASMIGALVLLATVQLMVVLDTTIVNVALPTIQAKLGFSTSGIAWVVNGYALTFGGVRPGHCAVADRLDVPGRGGAQPGGRCIRRHGGPRRGRRAAARRPYRRVHLVALGVLPQRPRRRFGRPPGPAPDSSPNARARRL